MVGLWESIPFSDPRWSIHFSNPISQPHKEGIVQAVDRVSDDSSEWGSTVDRKSLGGKIQVSEDGKQVIITTLPESDWWRTPEVDSASGLVWGYKRATGEGFEIMRFNDQACLFFYLNNHQWVKAGQEYDNEVLWDGVVITNPFSDWSIQPRSGSNTYTISYSPPILRVFRGEDMIREVRSFTSSRSKVVSRGESGEYQTSGKEEGVGEGGGGGKGEEEVIVGVMGCSPKGGGVKAVFSEFKMREGVREV
ncbi:hypothetical protein TREMEDRAFT_65744 [Tremella mesenterica DSM 1558]|uniref:uncharacterized protein n=1 Tax=Tremella mesenterica (strain ATCC 24925 / CBS 8224 / DSM 1558 / NBRC 9311 / NRRL Y-6157 / RJB 2259-6 / UBC 559-6) TaxID=578456 RepID=UPI00032BD08A|nr:uncharacterized protein TREMEDRAFT_65744 [Tremella mesenterica DSM 1558]EIW66148.1 hypothetical protein TREMEDRAFT_65744 [Tremella mesenterica DSM 1558]